VPYGSLNNEVIVAAGQIVGLTVTADPPPQREYKVGEEYDFHLPVTLHLAIEDLTTLATNPVTPPVTPDLAPVTVPENGGEAAGSPTAAPATFAGLRVKNYAGDTLTFTINNQVYTIANNAEMTIPLLPGSYTYTASRPFMAVGGIVDLPAGQGIELSVAVNFTEDVLNVYQN
jgi:hypothetical protein